VVGLLIDSTTGKSIALDETISHSSNLYLLSDSSRQQIIENSYIGHQGYTIPKIHLSLEEMNFLKTELTIEPQKGYSAISYGKKQESSFPIYRENINKFYIPRFYGISRYGSPNRQELSEGDSIQVPFVKSIRDYQEKIIQVYLDYISFNKPNEKKTGAILEVPCGRGKTVMALRILSILEKKTLILVHKEFLMNQWIERIHEFLPSARIGKIQGSVFDIENKDIVIGMIQSLYNRSFPSNAFSSFGLTIIDEVHRIGSEEFSKTLFKTITKYMLGISATVERKDGLTRILNMFIGDKIYSEERKDEDVIEVRAIEYQHDQVEYNEVEYDFQGNVKYSTMVSKISHFQPRCIFLVKILRDLIQEKPDKQIIVLSQTRSLLTDIFKQLISNPGISIGFYVGGMKPEDLTISEEKQIVLATYAMAAEALDIKSLNTLVMVSPKTDIIQSVGRILRTRNEGKLIIDIIDTHEVFRNQWKKRRAYYKKCGYGIRFISSMNYINMQIDSEKEEEIHDKKIETEKKNIWKRIAIPVQSCLLESRDISFDTIEDNESFSGSEVDVDETQSNTNTNANPKKKEYVCWIPADIDFDRVCYG
jgi:superfamily II DNA or RNA helicase